MIAPLRSAHRVTWTTLAFVLPIVLATVILATPGSSRSQKPGPSAGLRNAHSAVCGSALRVSLVQLPVIETSAAATTEDLPPSAPENVAREKSDANTILTFSSGRTMTIEEGSSAFLRVKNASPRLEIRATPDPSPLVAYSVSQMVEPGPGLAGSARLIDEIPSGDSLLDLEEEWMRENSSIAFYSLARDETLVVIHFHPEVIVMSPCL